MGREDRSKPMGCEIARSSDRLRFRPPWLERSRSRKATETAIDGLRPGDRRTETQPDPDAGASAGDRTGRKVFGRTGRENIGCQVPVFGQDHVSVRVGSAAMPAPFAMRLDLQVSLSHPTSDRAASPVALPCTVRSRKAAKWPGGRRLEDQTDRQADGAESWLTVPESTTSGANRGAGRLRPAPLSRFAAVYRAGYDEREIRTRSCPAVARRDACSGLAAARERRHACARRR